MLGLSSLLQGLRHFFQIAFHDETQLVQGEVDSMVGEAALREVVGAYAVRPIAAANQAFAQGGIFGSTLTALFLLNASR